MNILPVDPIELARDLIRCPSVTPHEAGALSLLAGVLKKQGFHAELVTFTEPGTPDVVNLYARIGSGSPCFVFAGHTDVVPTGDEAAWSQAPFSGEIVDGVLWGRGACDMKGGVAAAAAAAAAFVAQRGTEFGGSIAFLVTGDEEGPSINGMPKLLKWAAERGETFDHCLLGEPTNPTVLGEAIKIGRRGSMSGTIVVEGRQGHVAYPHLADNPIPGLIRLCAALLATPLDEGSDHFAPSNLEIVSIDVGNPVFNIIPREARAKFNIRMNDRHGIDSLTARLEAILAQAGADVKYRLEIAPGASASFLTQPDDFVALVADAVEQETGTRPALSTSGGTSDARHIKDHMTVLEFGLVGQTMHQIDERAPVADIERLAVIYRRVLERYFAS